METVSTHANTSLIIEMILPDIKELIESKRFSSIKIFRLLTKSKAEEVFSLLWTETQNMIINNHAKEEVRSVIFSMASDDRITLFEELSSNVVNQLLELLDKMKGKKRFFN